MSNNPITISVVLPTHNRGSLLRETLDALVTQTLPKSEYEVIVVDNRSTDETREILDEFSRAHSLIYLYEARLGAAVARNTGWRAAQGRWVAFVDDDVLVPPNWLESIRSVFDSAARTPACAGGPVRAIWEASRPKWLHDDLVLPLAIIDWSNAAKELTDVSKEWLVSANMAVSRDVLEHLGGFHSQLDKVGRRNLVNGEIHLQKRLIRAGYHCIYDPQISVRHHVRASRLTQAWFIDRYYHQGLSDFAVDLIETKFAVWKRLYTALGMICRLFGSPRNLYLLLRKTEDSVAFKEKCYLVVKVGYIAGLLGALRR